MRIAFCRLQPFLLAAVSWSVLCIDCHAQWSGSEPRLISIGARPSTDDYDSDVQPVVALSAWEQESYSLATAALNATVGGDFFEAPLTAVVWRLQAEAGCPIRVDEKALADAAIGLDTQITLNLNRNTLRTVLTEALRPHTLAWLPKHPGILITTQEQVDTNPDYRFVVLYPVGDLVADPYGEGDDFDSLIDAITYAVHPETWKEGGTGEGVIAPIPGPKALLITQPLEVQERIAAFLDALRKVQRKQGILPVAVAPVDDDRRYLVRPVTRRRRREYWSAGNDTYVAPYSPPRAHVSGF